MLIVKFVAALLLANDLFSLSFCGDDDDDVIGLGDFRGKIGGNLLLLVAELLCSLLLVF